MSTTNGFTANAEMFASSPAHAETGDLEIALEMLGDPDGRDLLDVATGTGHTAFFFAERHAHVFAVDINDEMLGVAQEEAERRSLSCRFVKGIASDLPFDDSSFDLVTTRLAAHHFASPVDFLTEALRVLRPEGRICVIDNVVPHGPTGDWINDYEKQRDPTHAACLTAEQWRDLLATAGFAEISSQDYRKTLDYDLWMKRMSIEGSEADALWVKLNAGPDDAVAYLRPTEDKSGRTLQLHRLVSVARKASPAE